MVWERQTRIVQVKYANVLVKLRGWLRAPFQLQARDAVARGKRRAATDAQFGRQGPQQIKM